MRGLSHCSSQCTGHCVGKHPNSDGPKNSWRGQVCPKAQLTQIKEFPLPKRRSLCSHLQTYPQSTHWKSHHSTLVNTLALQEPEARDGYGAVEREDQSPHRGCRASSLQAQPTARAENQGPFLMVPAGGGNGRLRLRGRWELVPTHRNPSAAEKAMLSDLPCGVSLYCANRLKGEGQEET